MQQYTHHEVHSRRVGQFVEEGDIDNFHKGWNKLRKGKLQKWVEETTHARMRVDINTCIAALHPYDGPTVQPPSGYESSSTLLSDASTSDDSDSDDEYFWHSTGMMEVVNGHFVAQSLDLDQTAEELMAVLEEDLEREKAAPGNASCSDTDHDSDAVHSILLF